MRRKTGIGFLFVLACCLCLSVAFSGQVVVNDITQLNPIAVASVQTPHTVADVQKIVRNAKGPVSIGGGRYSMGGQTATDNTTFIDMRLMNHVIGFYPAKKQVTVQAGMTWRALQEKIDPKNLSVKVMQSFANFTVGGSLSVNVHGRYIGYGPIVSTVKSVHMVLADGRLVEASPVKNRDLFYGAIGGYGGLGVIVDATLTLADNDKMIRDVQKIPLASYKDFFLKHVQNDKDVILHNGDFYPPAYKTANAVTWRKTSKDLTTQERFEPKREHYWMEMLMTFGLTELPWGKNLRERLIDPWRQGREKVVRRNYEASHDVAMLEPYSRYFSTYVLQEYFVPVRNFDAFSAKMIRVLKAHDVNVVNVSIRHAKKDPGTLMAWAREDVFAFVLYYKQGTSEAAKKEVGAWTRELIDAVLSENGTYYLPYQPHAAVAQFRKAYPNADAFLRLKRIYDPGNKFRNKLWDKYLPVAEKAQ